MSLVYQYKRKAYKYHLGQTSKVNGKKQQLKQFTTINRITYYIRISQ